MTGKSAILMYREMLAQGYSAYTAQYATQEVKRGGYPSLAYGVAYWLNKTEDSKIVQKIVSA